MSQIKAVYEEVEYFVQNQIEAIKTNLSVAEKLKKISRKNDSSVSLVCHDQTDASSDCSDESYSVAVEAEVSRTAKLMESRFNFEIGKCLFKIIQDFLIIELFRLTVFILH